MLDPHRTALVTGANKGIGLEIARQLGQAGVRVIVGARSAERGRAAAAELSSQALDASFVEIDITDEAAIARAALAITSDHGRLDILVNNAGIWKFEDDGAPSKTTPAVVRETMETNFIGTLAVTQAMLPLLRKSAAGRIVNLSSALGSLDANSDPGNPFHASRLIGYNASKAAVNMLTIQLAEELRDSGILVNAVSPGFVKTDMTRGNGFVTASEGAKIAVHYALLGGADEAVTGCFMGAKGAIRW